MTAHELGIALAGALRSADDAILRHEWELAQAQFLRAAQLCRQLHLIDAQHD